MLLETRDNFEVARSKPFKTYDMGIKNPQVLFDILCDKTYKYPMATMVQEYMSNARDAHREAGVSDKPVDIVIPTTVDPTLTIRDYGIGISPDRMQDVFIYLGESTKRGSNGQHGGFGIGAKIGFAYTETFHILSRYDGIETEYIAYKGPDRLGHIDVVSEQQSTEPSGVTIQLPIDTDDISKVARAVMKCCFFWRVQPNIKNIPDSLYTIRMKNWAVPAQQMLCISGKQRKDLYGEILGFSPRPLIVVDRIIYGPLEESKEIPFNKLLKPVALFVHTGEVNVAVNREGLQYNKATWITLNQIIKKNMGVSRSKAIGTLIDTPSYELSRLTQHVTEVDTEVVTDVTVETDWGGQTIIYRPKMVNPLSVKIPYNWQVRTVSKPTWRTEIESHDIVTLDVGQCAHTKNSSAVLPLNSEYAYILDDRRTQSVSPVMLSRWMASQDDSKEPKKYIILRHRDRSTRVDEWVFSLANEIKIDLLSNYVKKPHRVGAGGPRIDYKLFYDAKPSSVSSKKKTWEWLAQDDNNLLLLLPKRNHPHNFASLVHRYIRTLCEMDVVKKGQVKFLFVSNIKWYKKLMRDLPQTVDAIQWIDRMRLTVRNLTYERFKDAQIEVTRLRLLRDQIGSEHYKPDSYVTVYHSELLNKLGHMDLIDPYLTGVIEHSASMEALDKSQLMPPSELRGHIVSGRYNKHIHAFWPELTSSYRNSWDISQYKILTALMRQSIEDDVVVELAACLNSRYRRSKK